MACRGTGSFKTLRYYKERTPTPQWVCSRKSGIWWDNASADYIQMSQAGSISKSDFKQALWLWVNYLLRMRYRPTAQFGRGADVWGPTYRMRHLLDMGAEVWSRRQCSCWSSCSYHKCHRLLGLQQGKGKCFATISGTGLELHKHKHKHTHTHKNETLTMKYPYHTQLHREMKAWHRKKSCTRQQHLTLNFIT
jgi:hypothetical protein